MRSDYYVMYYRHLRYRARLFIGRYGKWCWGDSGAEAIEGIQSIMDRYGIDEDD